MERTKYWPKTGFLNLSPPDILDKIIVMESCPGPCRMSSGIPDLCLLDASHMARSGRQKCLWVVKSPQVRTIHIISPCKRFASTVI